MIPKDCDHCWLRRRSVDRRRRRAIAAGTWRPRIDAAPIAEHCRNLRAAGLPYERQAAKAGVHRTFIDKLTTNRVDTIEQDFADALKALTPPETPEATGRVDWVDACGTRRRIVGMGVNGWTYVELAQRLGTDKRRVQAWTRRRCVTRTTADKVKALADELYGVDGPSRQCFRDRLIKRGGVALEAWGEDIDDPAAVPDIVDMSTYVDEVKVLRAVKGELPAADLTKAERVAAVAELAGRGMSDREIAVRMRWVSRHGRPASDAVGHLRARRNIPSTRTPTRSTATADPREHAA
jgi:hypothetical protein